MSNITIIIYHYVREIKQSIYPNLKGLEIKGFKRQLDYLKKNYNIINPKDLINNTNLKLKDNSCLLTFDDGLKDHVDYVLNELNERNLKGCFFPTASTVNENRLLEVHAIQFILAVTKNISELISDLNSICIKNGYTEENIKTYWNSYTKPLNSQINIKESKEVIYFKRMLQFILPAELRSEIIKTFFKKLLNTSASEFAKKLYMNKEDLKKLLDNDMYIGSHTYNHVHLNTLNYEEQEIEIDKSLSFLNEIGATTKNWIMCYPYGSYDEKTISILKKKNCIYALTTEPGIANLKEKPFELPRRDTINFPQ